MTQTDSALVSGAVIVGVDTHKDVHVAVALDVQGRRLGCCSVPTTSAGLLQLEQWSIRYGTVEVWGVEGTGSYGAGLTRQLVGHGHRVREVSSPERKGPPRQGQVRSDRRRAGRSQCARRHRPRCAQGDPHDERVAACAPRDPAQRCEGTHPGGEPAPRSPPHRTRRAPQPARARQPPGPCSPVRAPETDRSGQPGRRHQDGPPLGGAALAAADRRDPASGVGDRTADPVGCARPTGPGRCRCRRRRRVADCRRRQPGSARQRSIVRCTLRGQPDPRLERKRPTATTSTEAAIDRPTPPSTPSASPACGAIPPLAPTSPAAPPKGSARKTSCAASLGKYRGCG
jgi:hypothetical protein